MLVLPGPRSPLLGERLAKVLGCPTVSLETKRFPDGEAYVRLGTPVRGEDVVVVQTTWPNDALVQLFLLQDALRRNGAGRVTVVVPYFAYARQDRAFHDGEAISAEAIMKLIGEGADRILTVDLHRPATLHAVKTESLNVNAVPAIAEYFRALAPQVVLAPDKNALDRAHTCARLLDAEVDHLVKKRIAPEVVEIQTHALDVKDKRVLIVDDIISTGGTMMAAAQELKRQGATNVSAACTHGLFAPGALDKLRAAGLEQTIATDTIEGSASAVTVAGELAKALRAG